MHTYDVYLYICIYTYMCKKDIKRLFRTSAFEALGAVPSQSGRMASTKNSEVLTWEQGRQVELKQLSFLCSMLEPTTKNHPFYAWCHPLKAVYLHMSGGTGLGPELGMPAMECGIGWSSRMMGRSRGFRFQKHISYDMLI